MRPSHAVKKVVDIVREDGLEGGLKKIYEEARIRVYEPNRVLVLLAVDLTNPKNRVRDKDRDDDFRVVPFDASQKDRLIALLEKTEPLRIPTIATRLEQGAHGLVAEDAGEACGYVFWNEGQGETRAAHADLEWLPMQAEPGEVYTYDFWIAGPHRGRGALFVRATQQAQFERGYTKSYGYVDAVNTAALWTYRTTGWKELGRVTEHKLLRKIAIVEDRAYLIRPFSRKFLGRVPTSWLPSAEH